MALIVVGLGLVALASLFALVFIYNFYQYATVEDDFASLPPAARRFGVQLVQDAAMGRMVTFGILGSLFGIPGLLCFGLGLRKKP